MAVARDHPVAQDLVRGFHSLQIDGEGPDKVLSDWVVASYRHPPATS